MRIWSHYLGWKKRYFTTEDIVEQCDAFASSRYGAKIYRKMSKSIKHVIRADPIPSYYLSGKDPEVVLATWKKVYNNLQRVRRLARLKKIAAGQTS